MNKFLKSTLLITLTLVSVITGFSQNNLGKTDDLGRVSLMPAVPQQVEGISESTRNILLNKLNQITTRNGLGGGYNNRFVITANIVVLSKEITATAPAMHALTLEVTLYIADYADKTIFASTSKELKGVGKNETKAYIQALKMINPADPVIRKFVENGKEKIIELYNSRCDFIIQNAEALAAQKKYDEAIFQLVSIPDACKECYTKALEKVEPIYKEYADVHCEQMLVKAKAEWAGEQNSKGASKASDILSGIDPEAACIGDVEAFISEMKAKIKMDEDRDWDFKVKQWDDEVAIEEQRVGAMKEVGVAYANAVATRHSYTDADFLDWIFNE